MRDKQPTNHQPSEVGTNYIKFNHTKGIGKMCIIYTRFSPRPDAATSESCEIQLAECEQYAAKKGWAIRQVFFDKDKSGSDEFREVLWQAIDTLKKGDVLLVYKRDRLARNLYLAETIARMVQDKGCQIVAVSGDFEGNSPEITLVRQIIAAMAEYERKLISIRTSASMRQMMRQGRKIGGVVAYGVEDDPEHPGMVRQIPAEQEVISIILKLRAEGKSYQNITDYLNANYKDRARGSVWYPTTVQRIVHRDEWLK